MRTSVKRTTAWPPGKQVSSASSARSTVMPGVVHVGEEHRRAPVFELRHDDRECSPDRARDEPFARR